ncbi:unnamed protein product, partial [marine sediment metagenome]
FCGRGASNIVKAVGIIIIATTIMCIIVVSGGIITIEVAGTPLIL